MDDDDDENDERQVVFFDVEPERVNQNPSLLRSVRFKMMIFLMLGNAGEPANHSSLRHDDSFFVVSDPNFSSWQSIQFVCVVCYLDRTNISVALSSMAADAGWSKNDQGFVLSAFFWGYLFTQILGGWSVLRTLLCPINSGE